MKLSHDFYTKQLEYNFTFAKDLVILLRHKASTPSISETIKKLIFPSTVSTFSNVTLFQLFNLNVNLLDFNDIK